MKISIDVIGLPVAQGSLTRAKFGLRYSNAKQLSSWRTDVVNSLLAARTEDWQNDGAFSVTAIFRFQRPLGHTNKKNLLRKSAPLHKSTKPDLDKLQRACGDSLEMAALIKNDSQICEWIAKKCYCIGQEPPGVHMTITNLNITNC